MSLPSAKPSLNVLIHSCASQARQQAFWATACHESHYPAHVHSNNFLTLHPACFLFWGASHEACGILVPWPGIEFAPLLWKHSLNYWSTRQVPSSLFSCLWFWRKVMPNSFLNPIPPLGPLALFPPIFKRPLLSYILPFFIFSLPSNREGSSLCQWTQSTPCLWRQPHSQNQLLLPLFLLSYNQASLLNAPLELFS